MSDTKIRIMVSRHSAFYSPLIATIAGGFLAEEGLGATYATLPPGGRSHPLLQEGEVDVMQSAPGSNWGPMERGETDLPVHFALINRRDGFFLAGRRPEPDFTWKYLEGRTLLADHGKQPLLMLQYAAKEQGVNWANIDVVDAGSVDEIDAAFRGGRGDYVHQQGPAPQQLQADGIGQVVASVGAAMPEVAFSTLMATKEFLATDAARAFMRAYAKSREWVQRADPREIAEKEAQYFEGLKAEAVAAAIGAYQKLGCWTGDLEVTPNLYEQALNVFEYGDAITCRHPAEAVVVEPPA